MLYQLILSFYKVRHIVTHFDEHFENDFYISRLSIDNSMKLAY